MGWSAKHGLRPNRPRPFTEYVDGKPVRKRHTPREPGYRVVGVLTSVMINVHAVPKGFFRRTTTRTLKLHPTKGFRVEAAEREVVDWHSGKWPPADWSRGITITNTFKRAAA